MSFRALFVHFREMKHYFIASSLVFITGLILGYSNSAQFDLLIQSQLEGLKNISDAISQKEPAQLWLFIFIFVNNIVKSIFSIFFGVVFGLFPLFFLVVNGMILGYIGEQSIAQGESALLLKGILPHGIIEIPMIVIASAYGIRFGVIMLKGLFFGWRKDKRSVFEAELLRFIKITVPLIGFLTGVLLIAALIESTFTVWLIGK